MAVSRLHTVFHHTMFKMVGVVFLILVLILGCDAVSTIANTDSSSSTSGTSSTGGGTPSGDGSSTGGGTTTGDGGTSGGSSGGGTGGGGGGVVFSSEVSTGQAEYISFAADAQNGYLYVAYLDVPSTSVVVKKTSLSGDWIEIGNFNYFKWSKNVKMYLFV